MGYIIALMWTIVFAALVKFFVKNKDVNQWLNRKYNKYIREKEAPLIEFKSLFLNYFEGVPDWDDNLDYFVPPVESIPIKEFGITDFKVSFTTHVIRAKITLEKPGLLIGKGGRVINALQVNLSEFYGKPVIVTPVQSKLWR